MVRATCKARAGKAAPRGWSYSTCHRRLGGGSQNSVHSEAETQEALTVPGLHTRGKGCYVPLPQYVLSDRLPQSTDSGLSQDSKGLRTPVPSSFHKETDLDSESVFALFPAMPVSHGVGLTKRSRCPTTGPCSQPAFPWVSPTCPACLSRSHRDAKNCPKGFPKGKENGEPTSPSHMGLQSEWSSAAEVATTTTLLEYWAKVSVTAWQSRWGEWPSFKCSHLPKHWPLPGLVLCIRVSRALYSPPGLPILHSTLQMGHMCAHTHRELLRTQP